MPGTITVAIEGDGAARALEELLAIPGLQGSAQPDVGDDPTKDGGVLAAIGIIVGIASGAVTIADKIIAWRDKWKKEADAKRLSVVIQDAKGNRFTLDRATPELVAAALQTLNR